MKPLTARLVIGIDPALKRSGFAYRIDGGPCCYGTVDAIHLLGAKLGEIFEDQRWEEDTPIHLLTEYPTWRGHGAEQVRAAANIWIDTLKARYPRRVRIMKVTPQTWMARMIPGWVYAKQCGDIAKPSGAYVPLAAILANDLGATIDENAAAAICLQALAEDIYRDGQWGTKLTAKALREGE